MVVLRCPYCGERVKQNTNYCSKCGKEFDKPHIDDVDTSWQETGSLMVKFFGFIILWFLILLCIGFVVHALGLPMNYWLAFIGALVLTVVIWIFK